MEIKPTKLIVFAEGDKVIVQYEHLVGKQWMTPEMARDFADALIKNAEKAETWGKIRLN